MSDKKKSIFGVLKESLAKTGCCGATCETPSKKGTGKSTVSAQK